MIYILLIWDMLTKSVLVCSNGTYCSTQMAHVDYNMYCSGQMCHFNCIFLDMPRWGRGESV